MKILKYLFFLLLIVFIAGSIYVATKDGVYQVEESRIFEAPGPLIFEEINNYETWTNWSWLAAKETQVILGDTAQGINAKLRWEGGEINDGSLLTKTSEGFTSLVQQLTFDAGITQSTGEMYWKLEPVEEGTRVTWGLRGEQDFKEKLSYSLRAKEVDEIFTPILETGLASLEASLTAKMEEFSIKVNGITQHGGGFYMYTTTATRMSEVQQRGAEMLEQVRAFMEANEISVNGNPFLVYNERDEDNGTAIFSAAIPTPSQVVTPSGSSVLTGYLPAQKVVKTTLKGNHKNARLAWEEAFRFIEENGFTPESQGEAFEIFITDPLKEVNPALWITEIYIPIE